MGSRFTKGLPEFVYFWSGDGNTEWANGPYVRPQAGRTNRKFKLVEVPHEEKKKRGTK